ncbi:3181_t:CDS:1, partial [Acaulospora colombiana]
FLSREEMLLLVEEDKDVSRTVALVIYSLTRGEKLCSCKLPVEIFNKPIYGAGFSTKPESRLTDRRHMSPSTMFKTDPALAMICVSFRLAGNPEFICIVLAVGPFRRICNDLLKTHPNRDQFDWDEWGPSVTSWIPCPAINVPGYRCTSGPRILMSGELSVFFKECNDPLGLILMDFNPRPIKRHNSSQQTKDSDVVEFAEGLEWTHRDIDFTIKTTLPFRAFGGKSLPCDYSNFHFEGNTIICRM